MTKYTKLFKFKVVQDYLTTSLGLELIARKYRIKSHTTVNKWVRQYQYFGTEGLEVRRPEKVYDGSFKVNVLKWMKTNQASLTETALNFDISAPSTIWQWQRTFESSGVEALYRGKGQPKLMPTNKQNKKIKQQSELEQLREENELLKIENEYLKKLKALVRSQQDDGAQIIQKLRSSYKLVKILKVVGMAKSTYNYAVSHVAVDSDKDAGLKQTITDFKTKAPAAGYRQVTGQLREMGIVVNHKKVLRLMRELNLLSTAFSKQTRKYNFYKGTVGTIAKNRLNRRFMADRPYQKLTTDITEIRWGKKTIEERAYFTCIYDLFSGEVLSYNISLNPTVAFTMRVLESAIDCIPKQLGYHTTIHSDQGFQYQNFRWVQILKKHRIFQSMSRKATCLDNAAMESFFHIMKAEVYYQKELNTLEELTSAISSWIQYYNFSRIKTKLGGKSPVKYRILTTQKVA
ncbi:IS3 family transposase [Loigolactobacillus zhaoyuanensis]|uniref:IS3 family transposase n=1 Tax=Loigolactobacillus zhaoyuanensis TaxID=2486017 RepID=A0ABW8UJK6_9LACO